MFLLAPLMSFFRISGSVLLHIKLLAFSWQFYTDRLPPRVNLFNKKVISDLLEASVDYAVTIYQEVSEFRPPFYFTCLLFYKD
ncbi:hypothetical protein AAZX31_15G137200 [Glycine max]